MNEIIRLLDARCSTRAYEPAPPTDEEKRAILHAAMRAPTAGNLMLYSIIEIEDQALKDRLAVTCDDQPFIARAPWVLLFVADFQKWMDLFAACGCDELPGVPHGVTPGLGDLMMACNDAADRGAERGGGGRVARHRLVLHRRHHGARRDARRAAAAAALHVPRGDAVLRPPEGPPRAGPSGTSITSCTRTRTAGSPPEELGEVSRELDELYACRRGAGRDVRLRPGRVRAQVHGGLRRRDEPLGGVVARALELGGTGAADGE